MWVKRLVKVATILSSFVIVHAQTASTSGTCTQYPSNATCSNYINYSAYIPNGLSVSVIENQLQSIANISTMLNSISPVCFDTLARYECSKAYPKCVTANSTNYINVYSACTSACEAVNLECGVIFEMAGYTQLLPNCTTDTSTTGLTLQSDDVCNNIPTKLTGQQIKDGHVNFGNIPSGFVAAACPSPFLKDPLAVQGTNNTIDPTYCRFGCCIACPAQNYLYKEHWAERAFFATNVIRFVSAVFSFIFLVSYLVLPDKRRHPQLLILNFAIAIFLFNMCVFFSIRNPKDTQCASNQISQGSFDNNALCAAQGAVLILGSFGTCLWCAALILNLHVHTVWNSNFFTDKYVYFYAVCWGIPVAIMGTAIGLHAIKFEFANLCLLSMEYIFPMFFYPLAAVVVPSFLIHMATFFYIAKVAVREGVESDMTQSLSTNTTSDRAPGVRKHVIVAVKIQWRALLLAIIATVTVLFYWLFYMTQMKRMTNIQNNLDMTNEWLGCMLTPGSTQNGCHDVISSRLPPFRMIVAAETLAGTLGIWLFIMFAKRSLWREWNDLIYDVRVKLSGRNRSEKIGEQFFAL